MALDRWTGKTIEGEKAEYLYNQTDRGCSASRKVRDHLETRNPVKRGLTRKQVEALFRDLP